jgi:hypothetical protein
MSRTCPGQTKLRLLKIFYIYFNALIARHIENTMPTLKMLSSLVSGMELSTYCTEFYL